VKLVLAVRVSWRDQANSYPNRNRAAQPRLPTPWRLRDGIHRGSRKPAAPPPKSCLRSGVGTALRIYR